VVAQINHPPMTVVVAPKLSGRLRVSSFLDVAREIIEAIRVLEYAEFDDDRRPSDWFIIDAKVRKDGAFVLSIEPETATGLAAANRYRVGLRMLGRHHAPPAYFTADVLRHTNKAMRLLEDGVSSFDLKTDRGRHVTATRALGERVQSLVAEGYEELTTLDGLLHRIEWDELRPRFYIVHALTGSRVRCEFHMNDLEAAKKALPHRVEVSGLVRYDVKGVPVSIDVTQFEQIPDDADLPSLEDLRGLNITNGTDPSELIWRVRNGS
jgi:hypothetical protein